MMAASYVVGMELPGAQALFARLQLTFGEDADLYVDAKVTSYDERYRMLTLDVCLCGATGELRALSRPPPVELDPARIDRALSGAAPLAGKSAVVIGGGRGLGAALAVALARAGAQVVATYAAAREAAEKVAALDERLSVVRSDASRADDLGRVRDALSGAQIDLLVLSASPPVLPMSVGPSTLDRARAFVDASLALVATPLAALGPALAKGAKVVVVSSSYVDDPPDDFAHYAAAKGAVEGFARAFAKERSLPLVVARPPRVLTDMTNTAFGADDALRTEDVAARIVLAAAAAEAPLTLVTEPAA
jgi:NAD(P)-dependent dehydrogenase (short-subunit alcohol dehydrogenase family)